jgi:hypothetical protein
MTGIKSGFIHLRKKLRFNCTVMNITEMTTTKVNSQIWFFKLKMVHHYILYRQKFGIFMALLSDIFRDNCLLGRLKLLTQLQFYGWSVYLMCDSLHPDHHQDYRRLRQDAKNCQLRCSVCII